jgi:succinate-semialdehyde dehydrogenase/glutarate-semialdehyde dehydrogenase
MPIATVNPTTGETLQTFEPFSTAEINVKLQRSLEAFRAHRVTTFADRGFRMRRAAEILEAEKDRFAKIMTTEMG